MMLRHGGGHGPSGGTNLSVRFYMYTERALDHGWFDGCPSFQAVRSSSNNDNLAEVGLRHSLLRSPLRVHSPQEARLFYVPVFEFASFVMGECANTTHPERMAAAHAALQASPFWKRHRGRDHFFASSAWSWGGNSMSHRMLGLSGSLKGSIVGRYKSGPFPAASRVGSCVIAIPWESNPAAVASYRPPQPRATPADAPATSKHRPLLMHFAGSLDVCCTGQHIRCAMGPLAAETAGESDVLMRYIIPPNRSLWKPCTRRAVQLMHEKQGKLSLEKVTAVGRARQALLRAGGGSSANETTAMLARRVPGGRHGAKHLAMSAERQLNEELPAAQKRAASVQADANSIKENWRYVATSLFEQTAHEMASSVFCLMPAGDNGIRSLMYSAIAAGCLPVILCDSLTPRSLPFSSIVPWESFWIKLSTRNAQRDPLSVLRSLRAINGSEVRRRQRIMAHHRADLVYGLRDSRVGDNFVMEAAATRCAKLESSSA